MRSSIIFTFILTIALPQWVKMARSTPSFSHHASWATMGACERMIARPHHRPGDRCTIAHIQVDTAERLVLVANSGKIWNIKHRKPVCSYPIAHGWRPNRVLHRESLEAHAFERKWLAGLDRTAVADRKTGDRGPSVVGSVDRARRTFGKAEGVVAMGVGQHDRRGRDPFQRLEPVKAAIDHEASAPLLHEKGAVPMVAARSRLDLTASAEKSELDVLVLARWVH
jgi:hypothetical protein